MLLDYRTVEQIETSCHRLKLYDEMETYKINTTKKNVDETIMKIMEHIYS